MKKKIDFLYKKVEDKTIVWFDTNNQYFILEHTTANILERLSSGAAVNEIAETLTKKLSIPLKESINFVLELQKKFFKDQNSEKLEKSNNYKYTARPKDFKFTKYYKINDVVFKISFLSDKELSLVHPKFAHLVIDEVPDFNNEFEVFINHNYIFLYVNNAFIGSWDNCNIHFFQGKFSMELIQKIHQKEENDWFGVFHASAISNGKKSMLFLGDSGNGKSTSLALLQANGFTCLADDFVPVDAKKQEVYSFPAEISIKKSSLEALLPIYSELETSAEYNFKRLNKIVRYLKPNNNDFSTHLPCHDLVFIKYMKDAKFSCKKISKIDAFQQLVPDSWLSTKKENAQTFLNWFEGLNCYQLTYSNNEEMIKTVTKIFNN
ncbi:MAG: hypothetical protein P8P38_06950 [Flavobacteriaceae bacterium]|nr:hypothetical protein [Flavobacteriaceae bacterium]